MRAGLSILESKYFPDIIGTSLFVDASSSGFGSTLLVKGNFEYRIGNWLSYEDKDSSNWREFEKLVCEVEQAENKGWLRNSTAIVATDNPLVESAIRKGNSSSVMSYLLVKYSRKAHT